jgi:hypothetical protein
MSSVTLGDLRDGDVHVAGPKGSAVDRPASRPWRDEKTELLFGALGSLLILGPFFRGGVLLGLDVAVLPTMNVPSGVWGLGPELPRRGLWLVPTSWLGQLVGGTRAVALLLAMALTCGFVGAARLSARAPKICRVGSGALYAFSPFVFTRIGVGHLSLVIAMGILPFAIDALLHPGEDLGRTFRWSAALALTGVFGGALACVALAVGVVVSSRRRLQAALVGLAGQALWLVPLLVVAAQTDSGHPADSSAFGTNAGGFLGLPRLLAGDGFWAGSEQVGLRSGVLVALLGLALLALAVVGHHELSDRMRRPMGSLAMVSFVLVAASGVPGVSSLMSWVTGWGPFGLFREGQRLLPLTLVWLAPAAALGAARLAHRAGSASAWSRVALAAPLAVALLLAGPGIWGAGGRLVRARMPHEWEVARSLVDRAPGTVLALPWHQHMSLGVADGRRVLDPVPELFPGDVLASTDLELGASTEPFDDRQAAVVRLLDQGRPVSTAGSTLGVRWIASLPGVDPATDASLASDPGLEIAVDGPALRLYQVRSWRSTVVDADGHPVPFDSVVAPLARIDPSPAAVWHRSGGWGWLRGTIAASETADGELALPAGRGLVWYWPATLTLCVYLAIAAGCLIPYLARRRSSP